MDTIMFKVMWKTIVGMIVGGVGLWLAGGLLFGWENAAKYWWILPTVVAVGGITQGIRLKGRARRSSE
ncbi:hypothetical protein [Microbacterium sp. CJ88]|uniref:hypothetical protein n=1 Tax=Microbacterium sp. CJ88 TaxID=3445672 RepID=UPI003F65511C